VVTLKQPALALNSAGVASHYLFSMENVANADKSELQGCRALDSICM
jgi:hypothetical protein